MSSDSPISESRFVLLGETFPQSPVMPVLLRDGDIVHSSENAYQILGAPLEVDLNNAACYRARLKSSGEIVFLKAYFNPMPIGDANDWCLKYVDYNAAIYRKIENSDAREFCVLLREIFIGAPESFLKSRFLYSVFPFLGENLTLQTLLNLPPENPNALTWEERIDIARHFVRGVHLLHAQKIVHSDLKPEQILLIKNPTGTGKRYEAKLNDLDFAFFEDKDPPWEETRGPTGTPWYYSPEYVTYCQVDMRSDIFSVSLVLCELLCGKHPYRSIAVPAQSYDAMLCNETHCYINSRPKFLAPLGGNADEKTLSSLIRQGLSGNPALRPHIEEIVVALG